MRVLNFSKLSEKTVDDLSTGIAALRVSVIMS